MCEQIRVLLRELSAHQPDAGTECLVLEEKRPSTPVDEHGREGGCFFMVHIAKRIEALNPTNNMSLTTNSFRSTAKLRVQVLKNSVCMAYSVCRCAYMCECGVCVSGHMCMYMVYIQMCLCMCDVCVCVWYLHMCASIHMYVKSCVLFSHSLPWDRSLTNPGARMGAGSPSYPPASASHRVVAAGLWCGCWGLNS